MGSDGFALVRIALSEIVVHRVDKTIGDIGQSIDRLAGIALN
jgi:hypothetical protein